MHAQEQVLKLFGSGQMTLDRDQVNCGSREGKVGDPLYEKNSNPKFPRVGVCHF